MPQEDLAIKINTLENNHNSFISELRKTNETLEKIERAIEKQNEIHTDLRLLSQKYDDHVRMEQDSFKRANERIEKLENIVSRLTWAVVMAVIGAVIKLVIMG